MNLNDFLEKLRTQRGAIPVAAVRNELIEHYDVPQDDPAIREMDEFLEGDVDAVFSEYQEVFDLLARHGYDDLPAPDAAPSAPAEPIAAASSESRANNVEEHDMGATRKELTADEMDAMTQQRRQQGGLPGQGAEGQHATVINPLGGSGELLNGLANVIRAPFAGLRRQGRSGPANVASSERLADRYTQGLAANTQVVEVTTERLATDADMTSEERLEQEGAINRSLRHLDRLMRDAQKDIKAQRLTPDDAQRVTESLASCEAGLKSAADRQGLKHELSQLIREQAAAIARVLRQLMDRLLGRNATPEEPEVTQPAV